MLSDKFCILFHCRKKCNLFKEFVNFQLNFLCEERLYMYWRNDLPGYGDDCWKCRKSRQK